MVRPSSSSRQKAEAEARDQIMTYCEQLDSSRAMQAFVDLDENVDRCFLLEDLLLQYIGRKNPRADVAQILGAMMYAQNLSLDHALEKAIAMKQPDVARMLKSAGAKRRSETLPSHTVKRNTVDTQPPVRDAAGEIMTRCEQLDATGAMQTLVDLDEKVDSSEVLEKLLLEYISIGAPREDVSQILGAMMYARNVSLDRALDKARAMKLPRMVKMLAKAEAVPSRTVHAQVHGTVVTCQQVMCVNDVKVIVATQYSRLVPDITVYDTKGDILDDSLEVPNSVVARIKDRVYDVSLLKESIVHHARGSDGRGVYLALDNIRHLGKDPDEMLTQVIVDHIATGSDEDNHVCAVLGAILAKRGISLARPLAKGCQLGKKSVVKLLIDAKADLRQREAFGHSPVYCAVLENRKDVLRTLLRNQADVNLATPTGWTPLHIAAHNGQMSIVSMLLKSRANVHASDDIGRSPIQVAETAREYDIMHKLVQAGAQYEPYVLPMAGYATVQSMRDSLQYRSDYDPSIDFSWEKGLDKVVEREGETPGALRRKLLEYGPMIEQFSLCSARSNENQPRESASNRGDVWSLHVAAASGELDVIISLLEQNANVNTVGARGFTPLHKAVESGHVEAVRLLLSRNANPNHDGGKEKMTTPLILSTTLTNTDVMKVLLANGADVNYVGKQKRTALRNAVKCGDSAMVRLLVKSSMNFNSPSYMLAMHESHKYRDITDILLKARDECGVDETRVSSSTVNDEQAQRRSARGSQSLRCYTYTAEDEQVLSDVLKHSQLMSVQ